MPGRVEADTETGILASLLKRAAKSTVAVVNLSDKVAPSPPTGIVVTSSTAANASGEQFSDALITWVAPTTNADGSTLTDLAQYRVAWKKHSATQWSGAQIVDAAGPLEAYIAGLPLGVIIDVRVRAVDTSDNKSTWAELDNQALTSDTTGPNKPSTPTVTPIIAGLRVAWDGKDSTGGAQPFDFQHTRIYYNTVNSTSGGILWGVVSTTSGGSVTITNLAYGTNYYVYMVAYDKTGNASIASNIVGPNQILHVNGATGGDVTSLAADIITAGTLNATFIALAGRLTTQSSGLQTGQRVEYDNNGIRMYNSSSTGFSSGKDFDLSPGSMTLSGTLTVTGTISGGAINGATITGGVVQTASSGNRWVLDSAAANSLKGYSGHASETLNGLLNIDNDGSRPYALLRSPRFTAGATEALIQLYGGNASGNNSDVRISSPSGNGRITLVAGTLGVWVTNSEIFDYNGTPYPHGASGTASVTTDASGNASIPHGLGVTPSSKGCNYHGATARVANVSSVDATNVNIHVYTASTGVGLASTAVSVDWYAWI